MPTHPPTFHAKNQPALRLIRMLGVSSRFVKPTLLALLSCSLVSCATEYSTRYDPKDIWLAVNDRNPHAVRHYLQRGASPNTHDETGWSILHNACWLGTPKVVEVLVVAGADVNATGNNIFTPRFEAMWRDIPEIKQKICSTFCPYL